MSVKRVIDTAFWNDDKVQDVFSPEDKLFFLYLMTNPHTKQLGVYHITRKSMAFELGYSLETIDLLIDRFVYEYKVIKYSRETSEIAIKNYLRYSIVKGGKPVETLLKKEISEIKDRSLLLWIHDNIFDTPGLNETVSNILPLLNANENVNGKEKENGNVNGNENGNGNDNRDTIRVTIRDTIREDLDDEGEMPF